MRAVSGIYRYPIKGLSAEPLHEVSLRAGEGVPHDRSYAITTGHWRFDRAAPEVRPKSDYLMLARDPRLATLDVSVAVTDGRVRIAEPDGTVTSGRLDDPHEAAAIALVVGRYSDRPGDQVPELVAAPPMRFTDVSVVSTRHMHALSIVNLASVRDLEARVGRPIDPLRFRANVYVDGGTPWEEQGWIERTVSVGPVEVRGLLATRRCPATTVDPATGERDLDVPRLLRTELGHVELGVYVEVTRGGTARRGDTVTVHDPPSGGKNATTTSDDHEEQDPA